MWVRGLIISLVLILSFFMYNYQNPSVHQLILDSSSVVTEIDFNSEKIPASLAFDSEPTGLEFVLNGKDVVTTPFQGDSFFIGDIVTISYNKGMFRQIERQAYLKKPDTKLDTIILLPIYQDLLIVTQPYLPNTRILINGYSRSTTPYLTSKLTSMVNLQAAFSDGQTTNLSVPLTTKNPVLAILNQDGSAHFEPILETTPPVLTVNSQPSAAEVFIDGQLVGNTPIQLSQLEKDKNYLLEVRLKDFESHKQNLELTGLLTRIDNIALVRANAELRLTDPTNTLYRVWIDGTPYADAYSKIPVLAGNHTLEWQFDGYQKQHRTFYVEANSVSSQTLKPGISAVTDSTKQSENEFEVPDQICDWLQGTENRWRQCGKVIEKYLLQRIHVDVKRQETGHLLTAQNGEQYFREFFPDQSHYICEFFADTQTLVLCMPGSEWSSQEYMNMKTGKVTHLNGYANYSPSKTRILSDSNFYPCYGDPISIARIEQEQVVIEFEGLFPTPDNRCDSHLVWLDETRLALKIDRSDEVKGYFQLVDGGWLYAPND